MSFHHTVAVGDEVSIYATVTSVGRISIRINVEAWRRRREDIDMTLVTKAMFTFVAVDGRGQPRMVDQGNGPSVTSLHRRSL